MAGENFWLRLTTASAQCLRLSERFFRIFRYFYAAGCITVTVSILKEKKKKPALLAAATMGKKSLDV